MNEEKVLAKGTFSKINIPAIICAVIAIYFGVNYSNEVSSRYSARDEIMFFLVGLVVFAALAVVFFFWMSGCSITITNKRVYGTGAFKKRVDLPLDMISAVGSGAFKSIAVATSSGKIKFWFVKNRDEIFETVSNCLIGRQQKSMDANHPLRFESEADELKKYKELLDAGVITQEEFDAKKRKIIDS